MGLLPGDLPHLLHDFYMVAEGVKRSVEWLIRGMPRSRPVSHTIVGFGRGTWPVPFPSATTTRRCKAIVDGVKSINYLDRLKGDGLLWP